MKLDNLRPKFYWLIVLGYMAIIFYLSSIPLEFPEVVDRVDPTKFFLHLAEYSILGFLTFKASKKPAFSFFLSSVYGVSDELHQSFVPYRFFSLSDIFADALGSLIGVALAFKFLTGVKIFRGEWKSFRMF